MVRLLTRTAPSGQTAAEVSQTVLRLAVLLHAGIAPRRAWGHLAVAGDRVAAIVAAEVERGGDDAAVLDARGGAWRDLAAAWRVATTVGAPLAESLRGISAALRDAQEAADDVRVALAEPAATARLMSWLPLVAVGLGAVLGFDTIGAFGTPVGIGCLVGGITLILIARRWTGRLVRRAQPKPGTPGLEGELLAIALGGGVSLERASALVAETAVVADPETPGILRLSRTAGVPAVDLLRASAGLARHRARTEGRIAAAKLSSRLLLPLGVCTLPAFVLLGVVPMLLSVLSATPLSL